ncbi:MAG: proline dehydrogenase family protein [Bacteroidetes bacterium]|nr:proline dehydrogenase family protein [Bacteroidota bacterium]MBU1579533.1 proline dehydrogenase family protein [Bacteroidota bacterium]MBU2465566.1 proline dehydrogenase family protein [Bacteroidota bacterium]MBU2557103.1 proline dehydrogenase family protein [Bacteroidota bacterium]
MPKSFVWLFSKRYIAGKTIEDAVNVSKQLNEEGMMVTVDLLGEFITELEQAEANKNEYLNIIETIQQAGIDGNYSLKPTMFGLLIDKDAAYRYIREIVAKAASYNNFVRVDMEDSQCVDMEIAIFRKLKAEFPKNVGLVLQAYLKRTNNDIREMLDLQTEDVPVNYRLCKGIYVESEKIAYKKYETINKHFLEDLELMFQKGIYAAIATHDKPLVEGAYKLIEKYQVPKEKYEFQMLYGVTPGLRKSILEDGHRMRIYVPFGEQWFAYSTRRLKENPGMAMDIIKALFVRG